MFVGRQRELAMLEKAYEGKNGAFIPIYGRRRVGKSELILRFLEGKPALYYLGKSAPAQLQLDEFLSQASRLLDEPLLSTAKEPKGASPTAGPPRLVQRSFAIEENARKALRGEPSPSRSRRDVG